MVIHNTWFFAPSRRPGRIGGGLCGRTDAGAAGAAGGGTDFVRPVADWVPRDDMPVPPSMARRQVPPPQELPAEPEQTPGGTSIRPVGPDQHGQDARATRPMNTGKMPVLR